ncbi:MAG: ABC transporter ATP-binding protein [Nitrospira sp.]|nr:ABC transporter ATP-binding protein [Nitrospira sp.]
MSIISVENLSKQYHIGTKLPYRTFRETLMNVITSPAKWFKSNGLRENNTIWALKDVSFEVKQGEVLGIIGHNGAGKTTLLKILSRVTEPTEGEVRIRGRVGSLLEVGTGFHPELTGRENIFLNGAILGMRKEEIKRKFDEIVAFAEIEKFLDTPVKRYSSGMYVRLAFAVAAHLDPEILIVDEVLAVGDAQFQKKCLGKMGDVGKEGRTVLFVSHNMTALKSLCNRAIWIDKGHIINDGESEAVVANYLHETAKVVIEQNWDDNNNAPGNEKVRLLKARLAPDNKGMDSIITVETPLNVEFVFRNFLPEASLNYSMHLYTMDGICVLNSGSPVFTAKREKIKGICRIPANFLNAETYRVKIMMVQDASVPLYDHNDALIFDVNDIEREGNWYGKWAGVVRPKLDWQVETDNNNAEKS